MKTPKSLFRWGIFTLAAAAIFFVFKFNYDERVPLSYDKLLECYEKDKLTEFSEDISWQLGEGFPSEKEWLEIIDAANHEEQPAHLDFGEQRLLFRQNQTGDSRFLDDGTMVSNSSIYGKIESNGRRGNYSSLYIVLSNRTAPSVGSISAATGLYMHENFSVAQDTVTWQGIGKALIRRGYNNGSFELHRESFLLKGKAKRRNWNTIEITNNLFSVEISENLRVQFSSNYTLNFGGGYLGKVSGTVESSDLKLDSNSTYIFYGSFPREGKGNFYVNSSKSNVLSLLNEKEGRSVGYTSFNGSHPFSDENLPAIFNTQLWFL